jgi:hypothetical protein
MAMKIQKNFILLMYLAKNLTNKHRYIWINNICLRIFDLRRIIKTSHPKTVDGLTFLNCLFLL